MMMKLPHVLEDELLQGLPLDTLHPLGILAGELHPHEGGNEREYLMCFLRMDGPDGLFKFPLGLRVGIVFLDPGPVLQGIDDGIKAQASADGKGSALQEKNPFCHARFCGAPP